VICCVKDGSVPSTGLVLFVALQNKWKHVDMLVKCFHKVGSPKHS
jgi:hypothetical protein